jgi:hypothetical protein
LLVGLWCGFVVLLAEFDRLFSHFDRFVWVPSMACDAGLDVGGDPPSILVGEFEVGGRGLEAHQ